MQGTANIERNPHCTNDRWLPNRIWLRCSRVPSTRTKRGSTITNANEEREEKQVGNIDDQLLQGCSVGCCLWSCNQHCNLAWLPCNSRNKNGADGVILPAVLRNKPGIYIRYPLTGPALSGHCFRYRNPLSDATKQMFHLQAFRCMPVGKHSPFLLHPMCLQISVETVVSYGIDWDCVLADSVELWNRNGSLPI